MEGWNKVLYFWPDLVDLEARIGQHDDAGIYMFMKIFGLAQQLTPPSGSYNHAPWISLDKLCIDKPVLTCKKHVLICLYN